MSVVMTGGTGFLGLHLVKGMLLGDGRVTLLARGTPAAVFDRVSAFLHADGAANYLPRPLEQMLTVIQADLDLPDLGLSAEMASTVVREAQAFWHVAATVMLDGRDRQVWRTNVEGTRGLLRLAEQAPSGCVLRYVSTAFVAGNRRVSDVCEDDSLTVDGFENVYERSKHAAETNVRAWAMATGRPALILRPSILVPPHGASRGAGEHTMGMIGQIALRMGDRCPPTVPRLLLRIGTDPRAQLNLIQVDWAASTMLQLAEQIVTGVRAIHVVHEADTPVRSISSALEAIAPVRIRMMPAMPASPSDDERVYHRLMTGFLPYLYHRRRFNTAALRAILPDLASPPLIGHDDLRSWVDAKRDRVTTKVAA